MIVAILNLAAPLDYHLIFGAGMYTAVYIAARAVGQISAAPTLAPRATHAPETVQQVPGLHPAAALGRFPGVYRHCRVRAAGPRPGVRLASSRAPSRRRPSSTKSSPYSWPRRALNGPASCHKRRGRRTILDERSRSARSAAAREIFQAAMEEFGAQRLRQGHHGRNLCTRHGISKGMMYHYYSNKDELFLLCVQDVFQNLKAQIEQEIVQLEQQSPLAAIREFFLLRERDFQQEPGARTDLWDGAAPPAPAPDGADGRAARPHPRFEQALHRPRRLPHARCAPA